MRIYGEFTQHHCSWRAARANRTLAVPHIKTYARVDEKGRPYWMLVTSANLSKAAWGERQKNNTQLMIRSYELGVLFTPDGDQPVCTSLQLPFDYPLSKYAPTDRPWLVDGKYTERDSLGCVSNV